MTVSLAVRFILLFLALVLSAFFSAAETALFSLDSLKLKRMMHEGKNTSRIVRLLENPMRCLTTILAGNTLTNIAFSAITTSILIDFFGPKGVAISIVSTIFILLVFGEITPKIIAIHNNERLSYISAGPLYYFDILAKPLVFISSRICDSIISALHLNLKKEPTLTEEEFRTVMEVGHRHGVVGKSEKEMVVSILELTTTTAQEVMTPRVDIKAISANWDREKVLEFARQARHSKLPVFRNSFDNIMGMISSKRLFLEEGKTAADLVEPVIFVPATKRIDGLIKDFYRQNAKVAIVVDEYGGTAGLITLQDMLDEIFGEIYDEFKVKERLVEQLGEKMFRLSGKAPVYLVVEDCGITIPSGDYDTIAGFLLFVSGHIPQEGEKIEAASSIFTVEKVMGKRIKSVILELR